MLAVAVVAGVALAAAPPSDCLGGAAGPSGLGVAGEALARKHIAPDGRTRSVRGGRRLGGVLESATPDAGARRGPCRSGPGRLPPRHLAGPECRATARPHYSGTMVVHWSGESSQLSGPARPTGPSRAGISLTGVARPKWAGPSAVRWGPSVCAHPPPSGLPKPVLGSNHGQGRWYRALEVYEFIAPLSEQDALYRRGAAVASGQSHD